jgi:hypothetical protein
LVGEITTTGAASRYIKTCQELGFITQTYKKIENIRISKTGRAISALSGANNPFKLTIGQKFLALKSVLEKDYDTISILFDLIKREESERSEAFQIAIQERLKLKIEKAKETNKLYLVDKLKGQIEKIQKWGKAVRYYPENIEAPRVEWMLDLSMIEFYGNSSKKIYFKPKIDKLFENELISHRWLENEFPYIFSQFYIQSLNNKMTSWTEISISERLETINNLLSDSMKIFQTADIGKISADEFFEYSLGFLIQNKSTVASLSSLEEDLMNFSRAGKIEYRYVQTVSPADKGYIAKL